MDKTTGHDRVMSMHAMQCRWSALRKGMRQAGVLAALAGAAVGPVLAADAAAAAGAPVRSDRVEVSYRDAAKLTEGDRSLSSSVDWIDALSKYMLTQAERALPAGQRLSVTITDVQRAGGFEPGRTAGLSDIRIVRDSTPPRIDLTFQLESAQGAVLNEGERKLRDRNFLNRPRHRGEALGYEKNLIDAWLRKEFGPAQR